MDLIIKTRKNLERIVATYIRDLLGQEVTVYPAPRGYLGIVTVEGTRDKWGAADIIVKNLPEADRVLVVESLVNADLESIEKAAVEVAKRYIKPEDTFAIRTTRRGAHTFTSIDINIKVGAAVREATGAEVDLEEPSKPLYIEIFDDVAAICLPATKEYRKLRRDKPLSLDLFRKISIGQFVYEGSDEAVQKMGERIGRAAQTFEIGELVILIYKPISARVLRLFLEAVELGIESRYNIQIKSYGRPVRRVPVDVYELYQFVRDRVGEPLIVTDPKGDYISHIRERLVESFRHKRVNILIGAREGVPSGVFRFATAVVDLAPQVTIATDFVIPSLAIGLLEALEESGLLARYEKRRGKDK
ncbi:MAG: SPOUT family RNA methylase [Pyrobaculum sp.]